MKGKLYYIYLDFFLVFLVQNDKIGYDMNKKDKIEARKVSFAMFKVFSAYLNTNLCKFIYEYMDMNYFKFKIFTLEHIVDSFLLKKYEMPSYLSKIVI